MSAWSKEDGFCLGQKAVEEKSNEITAIPELLDKIQIKGQLLTIDAMGTQKEIVEKIKKKRAEYVLALKGNQKNLYKDVKEYFENKEFQKEIEKRGAYKRTIEKAHGQIEKGSIIKRKISNGWMVLCQEKVQVKCELFQNIRS